MYSKEAHGIGEAIKAYLEAIKTGESRYFERAFYHYAVVINVGEEDPEKYLTPIAKFAERVKTRHDEGTYLEEIPLGITTSQIGGIANVRLDFELRIGDQKLFGTDYFNMVKRDGEWRISQKIYDVTHTA